MEDFEHSAEVFVKGRFGDRAEKLAPLAAGGWAKAYLLTLDGREVVLRFGEYREDFEKDRVMGTFTSQTLPIPQVLEVGETEAGFYAISERVPGRPLEELSAAEIRLVLPELLHGLNEIQKRDLSAAQEVGLWRPKGMGPYWGNELLSVAETRDRLAGWREQLDASPQEARIFDAGVSRLLQIAPHLPEYRGIVHNDLLNRNVLVDAGRLTGVIDWGNALYGDPLYDIAWFLYRWPSIPAWQDIDLNDLLEHHWDRHGGRPVLLDERLLGCLIHLSLDHIAYYAFTKSTEDVRRSAEQLLIYI